MTNKIKELEEKIKELEKQVNNLERQLTAPRIVGKTLSGEPIIIVRSK